MRQRELAEKREEEQRGPWFNQIRPMTKVKQTWHEKRLAREENGNSRGSRSEEEVGVTSDKGESTSDEGNSNLDKGEDQHEDCPTQMEINMVFTITAEFRAPTEDVAELTLGAEHVVFKKPDNPGLHKKPLLIWGTSRWDTD
jgi:hypothetical protein